VRTIDGRIRYRDRFPQFPNRIFLGKRRLRIFKQVRRNLSRDLVMGWACWPVPFLSHPAESHCQSHVEQHAFLSLCFVGKGQAYPTRMATMVFGQAHRLKAMASCDAAIRTSCSTADQNLPLEKAMSPVFSRLICASKNNVSKRLRKNSHVRIFLSLKQLWS